MHSVIEKVTRSPCMIILTPEREEVDQMRYLAHQLGCPPYLFHMNCLQYWARGGNPE
jgi:hypothetical protein